jgi:hypothetical protein
MKTFKQYLAESQKTYSFKIKVAGELPESFTDSLKSSLERCKVSKLSKINSTPIQAQPMDFPSLKNCEVHMFEVVCEYPITVPELANDMKSVGIDESCFKIRGSNEPDLEEDTVQDANVKHKDYFGDDFNKGFLKDLDKAAKQRKKDGVQTEYKLPKAKTDKAGAKSALGS